MSTVGEYLRLTPEELNRVLDDPEVIAELVEQFIECEEEVDDSEPRHHDTDVAWAALEFLLDRIGFPVDIVRGEEDIPGASDWGNGPHRYLTSDQVSHAAQALAAAPKDFELRLFYARLLRDQRKFVDAAQQFFAATQIKPDSVEAWNELAAVLIVDAQYPQGIAALERLRSLGAETSAHLYLRAMSLDHLHQNKEALMYYEKFLAASQGKSPDEEFKARQRARILQKETGKR